MVAAPVERKPTAQDISDRLGGKKQPNGSYLACCPAHDDKKPSLSITDADNGGVVLHCHAGCEVAAILAKLGLTFADINPQKPPLKIAPKLGPIIKTFDYTDENGKLLYQVTRHDPKDFRQRQPDGRNGWINSVTTPPVRFVPYRLPGLVDAIARGVDVIDVEGEKDGDTVVEKIGLAATTAHGGANSKAVEAIAPCFKDANIVIVPDNDEAGRRLALRKYEAYQPYAHSIGFAHLPDKYKDATEMFEAEGKEAVKAALQDVTDQKPILQAAPEPAPATEPRFTLTKTRDVLTRPKPIYLYGGEIPGNSLITLTGASGNGKTFVALDYALTIAQTHKVIYVAAERPYAALMRGCAWLDHHRAQDDNLCWIERAPNLTDAADVQALTTAIKDFGAAFVVIDTFSRCADGINEDSNSEVKRIMQTLDNIRRDTGAAVMVVHHTGWGGGRERGASAMRDYAEVAILVERVDDKIKVSCLKMSSADEFEPRGMKLIAVGDQAVAIPSAYVVQTTADNLTPTQRNVLDALALPTFDQGARVAELSKLVPEIKAKDMYRVLAKLIDLGFARKDGRFDPYVITTDGSRKVSQAKEPHGNKVSQVSQ